MTVRQRLMQIGAMADGTINRVRGALLLAQWADPDLDPQPYHRHMDLLCEDARAYLHEDTPGAQLCAETVRQIVARRFGYSGVLSPNGQGEPGEQGDGANLAKVIDKRRGGGAALCIVYAHVLECLGITVEILDFPPRPLIRIQDDAGQRLVLDPLNGGNILHAQGLRKLFRDHRGGDGALDPFQLHPLSHRDILVALQDQVKVHHLRMAAPEAALAALEAALLIAPETARLWQIGRASCRERV